LTVLSWKYPVDSQEAACRVFSQFKAHP
jgi:hypothetical protein